MLRADFRHSRLVNACAFVKLLDMDRIVVRIQGFYQKSHMNWGGLIILDPLAGGLVDSFPDVVLAMAIRSTSNDCRFVNTPSNSQRNLDLVIFREFI